MHNIHSEMAKVVDEMIDRRAAQHMSYGVDHDEARRAALAYVLGYVQSCYASLLYECNDEEMIQKELDYLKKV
jgi:hypothetical protein